MTEEIRFAFSLRNTEWLKSVRDAELDTWKSMFLRLALKDWAQAYEGQHHSSVSNATLFTDLFGVA